MAFVLSLTVLQMSAFADDGSGEDDSSTTTSVFTFDKVWDDSNLTNTPQHSSITVELKDQAPLLLGDPQPDPTPTAGYYPGSYETDRNLWHCTVSNLPRGKHMLVSETDVPACPWLATTMF